MNAPTPSGPLPPKPLPTWLRAIGAAVVVVFGIVVIFAILYASANPSSTP